MDEFWGRIVPDYLLVDSLVELINNHEVSIYLLKF